MTQLSRSRWLGPGAVALALLAGALLGMAHVDLLRQPADFSIYYAAARVLASGGDPYNWHALQRVAPQVIAPGYVYPLWGLLPALAVAWLPLPVAAGLWLAGSCCCLVYAVRALGGIAGLSSRSVWLPVLVGVVCLSIPGLFVLIQGQVSLLLLAAVVGAYAALRADQPRWAGPLLALALAKPQLTALPALALLVIAWRGHRLWAVGRWAGGALGALAALSFAARPGWLVGWLAALGADAQQGGSGARALRANMGTIPALTAHLPTAAGMLLLLASIVASGWVLYILARRVATQDSPRTEVELLAGAICVATAISPWMWIYDGVFWLVALIALARWAAGWRRWLGLAAFWALPWGVRLWYVGTSAHGATSLNKLEDVLIAPLLLAALFAGAPRAAATPASVSHSANRLARQTPSGRTAGSVEQARRPAIAPRHPSPRE